MEDIWKRFEAPNDANRWDHPLFRVKLSPPVTALQTTTLSTTAATDTTTHPTGTIDSLLQIEEKVDPLIVSPSTLTLSSSADKQPAKQQQPPPPPLLQQQQELDQKPVVKTSSWKPKKAKQTQQEIVSPISSSSSSTLTTTVPIIDIATTTTTESSTLLPPPPPVLPTEAISSSSSSNNNNGILSISGNAVTYSDNLQEFQLLDTSFCFAIHSYLTTAHIPLPNSSTITNQHGQTDLLYELDRTSQHITQLILHHQAETLEGTPIKFTEYDRAMTLHRYVSFAELQRYRGQFVKINAQHPPTSSTAVGVSFIEFLAVHL
jgi:tRNA uridine 5-carbamoylmethylation protein Kti12